MYYLIAAAALSVFAIALYFAKDQILSPESDNTFVVFVRENCTLIQAALLALAAYLYTVHAKAKKYISPSAPTSEVNMTSVTLPTYDQATSTSA